MHPLAAAALKILVPIATKEITEEVTERFGNLEIEGARKKKVIDGKQTAKNTARTTAVLSALTAVLYALSAYGVIPPEFANIIEMILSNPETVEAIGEAVN